MIEFVTVDGPLGPERLRWVADLYANADPKFRRDDVLEHLLVRSPAGPALHAFALDDGRPVGHCCVVPLRTRLGASELRSGKLEALWVEHAYRGRQPGGETVVRTLLDHLYGFADERGLVLVHGIATARIGAVIRYVPLGEIGEPSLVAVLRAENATQRALAAGQRVLCAATPRGDGALRPATETDVDLAAAPPPPEGRWTVLAADAWDWYCASPLVRVLEQEGSRALVQLPGVDGQPLRVIGWRPARAGLRPALALVGATVRAARASGAGTVRFQPWASPAGNGTLRRACRLLGFVPRYDLTTLWVRTSDPALERAAAVVPSPLLYLGF